MKKETLQQHLFEHGRLTAYAKGERQVVWGVIADVNCVDITLMNHSREFQKFEMKAIKGFRPEPYQHGRKSLLLQCDCNCKAEERYICEKCGSTFCGSKHGKQERDNDGRAWDLCEKCATEFITKQ